MDLKEEEEAAAMDGGEEPPEDPGQGRDTEMVAGTMVVTPPPNIETVSAARVALVEAVGTVALEEEA